MNTATLSPAEVKKISRRLTQALRHEPEALGLQLSSQGWIPIDTLLQALRDREKLLVTREVLAIVVAENDKKRLTISEDGLSIRAAQGHSTTQVKMDLPSVLPPFHLFHGTNRGALKSILDQGLRPMDRHHVHLSADVTTAVNVGSRHSKRGKDPVVVLQIDARAMSAAGAKFYQADNAVWLTDAVPPNQLKLLK